MKILFVDDSSNLQEKWIEPLRGEGWGVVRARSTEDAEKIFEFHGDSLAAMVVSENFVEWAEKWNYPYVVFLKTWKESQVVKHQNSSSHPATSYLDYDSSFELVRQAITESKNKNAAGLKATGTAIEITKAFKNAPASSATPAGLTPIESSSAPASDHSTNDDSAVVISFEKYADQKVEIESTSHRQEVKTEAKEAESSNSDRTMMMDATSLSELNLQEAAPQVETIEPVQEVEQQVEELTATQQEIDLADAPAVEHQEIEEDYSIEPMEEISMETMSSEPVPSFFNIAPGNKDVETMKNYLALREQDVALLTGQMRSAQERVQQLENLLKVEKARNAELQHMAQKQTQQIQNFERDKQVEFEVLYGQVEDLNLQLRERTDKVRTIETKLKITTDEVEKVKERVRVDIRRIRVREKELESQLEILKKDSTALLVARDEKILELKRKIDLLEFNMELVQEQYGKERNQTEQLRHKLKEAAGVMKRAGGLLDHEN